MLSLPQEDCRKPRQDILKKNILHCLMNLKINTCVLHVVGFKPLQGSSCSVLCLGKQFGEVVKITGLGTSLLGSSLEMHHLGLVGKSFILLICNVGAVLELPFGDCCGV